jgi:hypothetical protein
MSKIATNEIKGTSDDWLTRHEATITWGQKLLRILAVAIVMLAGGYFVALGVIVLIVVSPIYLIKYILHRLSTGKKIKSLETSHPRREDTLNDTRASGTLPK